MQSPEISVNILDTEIFITQPGAHCLYTTWQSWQPLMTEHTSEAALFANYIICNETQETLHIQQVSSQPEILENSYWNKCLRKMSESGPCKASIFIFPNRNLKHEVTWLSYWLKLTLKTYSFLLLKKKNPGKSTHFLFLTCYSSTVIALEQRCRMSCKCTFCWLRPSHMLGTN